MSIRRGTPSIGYDEYDRPYIHWDDDPAGEFVAHADHEAAIRDCVIKVLLDLRPNLHVADLQGFYRGLTAARDAVAALCIAEWHTRPADREICGLCRHYIAAIDALAGES